MDADTAVAKLFAEHHTRLLRVATALLTDAAAAEDVVQDAYVALFDAWNRLHDKDAAAAYLHRSVVNGARSRLRRRRTARRHPPTAAPNQRSAEDTAFASHPGTDLVRALQMLPERQRQVVLLRHYLDLSERQAAAALGLQIGSIKAYGSRGLATLRERLQDFDVPSQQ